MILISITRNDVKRREVTCRYANGVDCVNSAKAQIPIANLAEARNYRMRNSTRSCSSSLEMVTRTTPFRLDHASGPT